MQRLGAETRGTSKSSKISCYNMNYKISNNYNGTYNKTSEHNLFFTILFTTQF